MNEINNEKVNQTPQREMLLQMFLKCLEEGNSIWKQGWKVQGCPISGATGKQYRGVNNLMLTFATMLNGYNDNRWVTFNQIQENDWKFKTDKEGKSLGKGRGVAIEFFELRDRETKKPFDKSVLIGMTNDEKNQYMDDNVYPLRKYFRVFNADIIDGIPEKEENIIDETLKSERVEDFIDYWSDTEVPIYYGGDGAYYSPKSDEIHLPARQSFISAEQFYSTALHEIGHSTGHKDRLNRQIGNAFGSQDYAMEELRAEIASLFMEQDFGVEIDESAIRNNTAYVNAWKEAIKNEPDAVFKAISDAEKIAKYVRQKEADKGKRIEHYAISTIENELGNKEYQLYMIAPHGQTRKAIDFSFETVESLMTELSEMQKASFYEGAEFREVSFDKLEIISQRMAMREEIVEQEKSDVYIKPSQIVAMSTPTAVAVDMRERGIESLTRMSDREIVEKAQEVGGETFAKLYRGERVFESQNKDDKILMYRFAVYSNDPEQTVRAFKSSGQFDESKPNSYYLQLAEMAHKVFEKQKELSKPTLPTNKGKGHFGFNVKS